MKQVLGRAGEAHAVGPVTSCRIASLQAWRKRWFVLRRGRMSGSPDVLEYYRTKHSSKPIRVIDLSECAVCKHVGPGFVRKEFQNNFVFIVKTALRTFYLVAKTEVEMLVWVYSISQVCNFGQLEDGAGESRAGVPVSRGRPGACDAPWSTSAGKHITMSSPPPPGYSDGLLDIRIVPTKYGSRSCFLSPGSRFQAPVCTH